MNIIKYWVPLLVLVFCSTSSATPPTLSQKYLSLKTQFDYLNTTENFDSEGGSIEDLASDNSYTRYNLGVSALYTFSTDAAIDLGLAFANAVSVDTVDERTSTQFTEVYGKFYYQLTDRPFEIIPEFGLVIPFNRFDTDTDDVLTGEGAMQFSAGSWFVKEFGAIYFYLYASYVYRDEGRSHLLPWKLGTEYDFGGFYLGTEANGLESVTDDEETDTPTNKTSITNRVNAGSLSFYSINPQEIAVSGWVAVDFSKFFHGKLVYNQGINGRSYGVNRRVMAMLEYKLDMTKNEPKKRSFIDRKARKRLRNFEIEDENYDEELFDKKKQRQRRKRKMKDKQLLNETEKILEGR